MLYRSTRLNFWDGEVIYMSLQPQQTLRIHDNERYIFGKCEDVLCYAFTQLAMVLGQLRSSRHRDRTRAYRVYRANNFI